MQKYWKIHSVQSLSHVWLCDPMDCSMPGFSVLHYFPKFAETHVDWISDAIQTVLPSVTFSLTQKKPFLA